MSALHAVGIVLKLVAVGADGARDFGQGDGAVPVDDNGILPFWLEQRADHIQALNAPQNNSRQSAGITATFRQAVSLSAVLLNIGGSCQ